MRVIVSYEEYLRHRERMFPYPIMVQAEILLVEFEPKIYKIVKTLYSLPERIIDLNNDYFLNKLLEFDFLQFKCASPELVYTFNINNCKYTLEADLLYQKVKLCDYAGNPVSLESFITAGPKEAVRPLLFNIDFFESTKERVHGFLK